MTVTFVFATKRNNEEESRYINATDIESISQMHKSDWCMLWLRVSEDEYAKADSNPNSPDSCFLGQWICKGISARKLVKRIAKGKSYHGPKEESN